MRRPSTALSTCRSCGLDLPDGPLPGIGTVHDAGVDLSEGFHDYGVEWKPDRITWMLDGHPYASVQRDEVPGGAWPFDRDMHLLLNLAVGGSWPGNDTDDPPLPAQLLIERVRVDSDHLDLLPGPATDPQLHTLNCEEPGKPQIRPSAESICSTGRAQAGG